jgi:hypothetical protein
VLALTNNTATPTTARCQHDSQAYTQGTILKFRTGGAGGEFHLRHTATIKRQQHQKNTTNEKQRRTPRKNVCHTENIGQVLISFMNPDRNFKKMRLN